MISFCQGAGCIREPGGWSSRNLLRYRRPRLHGVVRECRLVSAIQLRAAHAGSGDHLRAGGPEIGRYDALDAARVSRRIRESADLPSAVDQILNIYREALRTWETSRSARASRALEARGTAKYLRRVSRQFTEELATRLVEQDLQLQAVLRSMEQSRSRRLTAPFRQARRLLEGPFAALTSARK
jgi:hypothetical protein